MTSARSPGRRRNGDTHDLLLRTERTSGVSLAAWNAGLANNVVWTAFWFTRDDLAMSVSNVAITASTALLVALIVHRRHTDRTSPEPHQARGVPPE